MCTLYIKRSDTETETDTHIDIVVSIRHDGILESNVRIFNETFIINMKNNKNAH